MLKGVNIGVIGIILVLSFLTGCIDDGEDWRLDAEIERLGNYMDKYHPGVTKDEKGIYRIIHNTGNGMGVEDGQYVYVNFTSQIIFGDVYESTVKEIAIENGFFNKQSLYSPRVISVDLEQVLDGIYYSLLSMKVGDKISFVFPSSLGFSEE